jgi:hypothetical protein|tara:strand:+ start:421 stop:729 length:309 start_codon:yes stop_codon:yes gene_type:complete
MNDQMIDHFSKLVNDFGFPVIAAIGLGYFVYYVWKWVTKEISPTISSSKKTLIGLIDKVRMLDNDMIRLNIKLKMILQQKERRELMEKEYKLKEEELLKKKK